LHRKAHSARFKYRAFFRGTIYVTSRFTDFTQIVLRHFGRIGFVFVGRFEPKKHKTRQKTRVETTRKVFLRNDTEQRGGDMMLVKSALFCLALNSYRETRDQEVAAQIAAMKILQNRATLNHTHVCKEVAKHKQFSWVRKYGVKNPNPRGELDKAAWKQAKQLAKSVSEISVAGISKKHIYFNTLELGRRYQTKAKAKRIGRLLFY
jgi:hypothetical protein